MIYSYTKFRVDGVNGYTIQHSNTENNDIVELCTIDDVTFIYIPDSIELPLQPEEIQLVDVTLTVDLSILREHSPIEKMIQMETQMKIRSKYSLEDELYFSRISIGQLSGLYTMTASEQQQVAEFGAFVEQCRSEANLKRASVGLK